MAKQTKLGHKATREQWLLSLVDAVRPLFRSHDLIVPKNVRVTCGWPIKMGASKRIGECWDPKASGDGSHEISISPRLADPMEVAAVLVHELVHATVGCKEGHKGPFRKAALALGLEGKMTATTAGTELKDALAPLLKGLGEYPHAAIIPRFLKKQSTRMLKVWCDGCGYTLRTTQRWINEGLPTCACGDEMKSDAEPEEGE